MTQTSSTLDRVDAPAPVEPGDHERFSHYVRKDAIARAAVEGTPAIALCGKKWVPNRDPRNFPVCPECSDIYESMHDPNGDQ